MTEQEHREGERQAEGQGEETKSVEVTVASVEDTGTLKKRVNLEVPAEEIARRLDENFGELAKTGHVRGFRQGRAPRRLVEKQFGKEVREQVRLTLAGLAIEKAIEKADLKVLGEPEVDLEKIVLPDQGPMTLSFEVEVEPEFELPTLEGIAVTERPKDVTDKDIDEQVENLRWRHATLEEQPAGAKIEKNDHIEASIALQVGDQPPIVRDNIELMARAESVEGIFFEGLEQALSGAAVGEKRETKTTVGNECPQEAYRGKEAKLTIEVKKISKWKRPEFTDEMARELGYETVAACREAIRTSLEARKGQQVRQDMENQVRTYLLEHTTLDLPEGLTDRQTDRTLLRRIVQLRQMGTPPALIDQRLDDLRTRARDQVKNDLKLGFVVEKIARQYEIEVTDEEVNSVIAGIASGQGRRPERVRQEMMRDGSYQSVFSVVRERKVLEKLLETAKVTKDEAPAADKK